jgi:hypothetical protein
MEAGPSGPAKPAGRDTMFLTGGTQHSGPARWRGVIAAVVLAAVAGGAASPGAAEVLDRVLAVVSGTVITLSDARAAIALGLVDTRAARDPVETALDWLVDRRLTLDEAVRSGAVDVEEPALAQAMEAIRRRFPSDAEYSKALVRLGLDETRVRGLVRDTLAARVYVQRRFDTVLAATDDELREYFDAHRDRFVRDGRPRPFEEAVDDVRAVVHEDRRQQAVSAWKERLRRRADILLVYRTPG